MNKSDIAERVKLLNKASDAYYNKNSQIMSDYEFDCKFDELKEWERITGIVLANSPTQNVGCNVVSKLEEITHSHPMLSLDKTKSTDDLVKFSNGRDCVLSLKMDGLTVLNTYEYNSLKQSETRGNGEIGEIITHNARVFENFPTQIPIDIPFEVEGEAIVTIRDFKAINDPLVEKAKREAEELGLTGKEYTDYIRNNSFANPRSYASGSVRQLDSKITKDRHIHFVAWKIPFGVPTYTEGFGIAEKLGFEVVPYVTYNSSSDDIGKKIERLKTIAEEKSYPIDGLVISYNDVEYGKSLGITGHHPRHSLAFKFYDEETITTLRHVEWTMGKTGILTPTAIFDSVEIDGTIVSRASVHNVSILKKLQLGIGDEIAVIKANQIIPQIRENLTKSNTCKILDKCPICGKPTRIVKENDSEVLMCENPNCKGKLFGKLVHAASRNTLDIENLSESTIEKFINLGWLNSIKDIYHLSDYENEMKVLDGFGKKSVEKLLNSIERSRNTSLERFIYSLSIPSIGKSVSKDISKLCEENFNNFIGLMKSSPEKLLTINGFGITMMNSMTKWWYENSLWVYELSKEFTFETPNVVLEEIPKTLNGKTFVVTGSVNHYKNRDELKADIVAHGGTVVGSVSSKTSYLINNDINSTSSKNQKAKSLNVPIISEDQFLEMIH